MNILSILAIFVAFMCIVVAQSSPNEEKYSDDLNDFDIEEVMNNQRLFDFYANCFRTGKNCNAIAKKILDILPEAMETSCAKCTEQQKEKAKILIKFVIKKDPSLFLEFEKKWDPEREFRKNNAEAIDKEGIVLPE